MKVISEYFSEEKDKRKAVIILSEEILCIDFYEDLRYTHTIKYPSKAMRYVEDAAENFVLGLFKNYKDFSEV